MTRLILASLAVALFGCETSNTRHPDDPASGGTPASADQDGIGAFAVKKSDTAADARGVQASKIESTETEAAVRLFVIDKNNEAIEGILIALSSPKGAKYYTEPTDAEGFAEVLVPKGQTYTVTFLSLGRRGAISAKVDVPNEPNHDLKLTLKYKSYDPPPATTPERAGSLVLEGVQFETNKATLTPDSFAKLDPVVEYMTARKSARIVVSGHTDNVGDAGRNKTLSEKRAKAVRDYLVSKGIAADRVESVGYGAERPVASNDTEDGRAQNRRIEVREL